MKEIVIRKCPFCGFIMNGGSPHIYHCGKINNINKTEIRYLYIKHNFPEISNFYVLKKEYIDNIRSLPDIRKEYNIDYKSILYLIDYFGLKRRTCSESSILISVPKQKKTMIENYGVEWSSQLESVKELKRKKCLLKYGVDNVWKSDWFKENRDKFFLEKYGLNISDYNKLHWENLSEEDKVSHMVNSIQKACIFSSIELRIKVLLDFMSIQYISQMKMNNNKNGIYFFDICIGNIIIEINGDFWHANPIKYKKDDILRFPKKEVLCYDIWQKDLLKKKTAIKNGYVVIYIWESFIKKSTDLELIEVLKDILENKNYKDRNYGKN